VYVSLAIGDKAMNVQQLSPGYVYRIAQADDQRLRSVIATHIGAGSTYGGAAQWDFNSKGGRANLRPITHFTNTATVDISGDFGHAFNRDVEVRWKRRDDGDYDVLILSEQAQMIAGAEPLRQWNSKQKIWEEYIWRIQRYRMARIVQSDNRPPIRYIDYLASNGAVQFQRLAEEEQL
jgi:hypothetical protein